MTVTVPELHPAPKGVIHNSLQDQFLRCLFTDISLSRSRNEEAESITRATYNAEGDIEVVGPPLDQVDRAVYAALLSALLVDPKSPAQSALPWYASVKQTIPLDLVVAIYRKNMKVDRDPIDDILISMVKLRRTGWSITTKSAGSKSHLNGGLIDDYEIFPLDENPDDPQLSYRVSDVSGQLFFPLTLTGRLFPAYLFKLSEVGAWLDLFFFMPHTAKEATVLDVKKLREYSFSAQKTLDDFSSDVEVALGDLKLLGRLKSFSRKEMNFLIS